MARPFRVSNRLPSELSNVECLSFLLDRWEWYSASCEFFNRNMLALSPQYKLRFNSIHFSVHIMSEWNPVQDGGVDRRSEWNSETSDLVTCNSSICKMIIKRWKAKGCEKGQSRRLKKLFAAGHVADAGMEQAAGVTVTNVRVAQ
eukprot:COSAG05_NODE_247_length_12967_cov_6.810538_2_plen_145_part_00